MLPGNLSTGIGQCCSQHKVRPRSAHQKRLKLQEWFQCQLQESPALTTLLQWGKHATQVLFFWWTIDHIGWSWMLAPQHYNFNHLKPEGQQLKLHLTHMTESTEVAATHMCWGKVLPSAGSCAVAPLLAFPLRSWQQKTNGFSAGRSDVDGVSSGKTQVLCWSLEALTKAKVFWHMSAMDLKIIKQACTHDFTSDIHVSETCHVVAIPLYAQWHYLYYLPIEII